MTTLTQTLQTPTPKPDRKPDLASRYRPIGIGAVVAAALLTRGTAAVPAA